MYFAEKGWQFFVAPNLFYLVANFSICVDQTDKTLYAEFKRDNGAAERNQRMDEAELRQTILSWKKNRIANGVGAVLCGKKEFSIDLEQLWTWWEGNLPCLPQSWTCSTNAGPNGKSFPYVEVEKQNKQAVKTINLYKKGISFSHLQINFQTDCSNQRLSFIMFTWMIASFQLLSIPDIYLAT